MNISIKDNNFLKFQIFSFVYKDNKQEKIVKVKEKNTEEEKSVYQFLVELENKVLEEDNKPEVYWSIQHKGSYLCMDLHCKCGSHLHIDEEFVYYVECLDCKRVYMIGQRILAFELLDEKYKSEIGNIVKVGKDITSYREYYN